MTVISQHAFGIVCPRCWGKESRVLSKRDGKGYIRRRHECLNPACLLRPKSERRWTTYEFMSLTRRLKITPKRESAIRSALL